MGVMNRIRAFLSGGSSEFQPLELSILTAVKTQLDSRLASKLERRLEQVNLIQRLDGGREVNTYYRRRGDVVLDPETALTSCSGEGKLAEFRFRSRDGIPFSGSVWMIDGVFFSIEFDNPTEHVLKEEPGSLQVSVTADLAG